MIICKYAIVMAEAVILSWLKLWLLLIIIIITTIIIIITTRFFSTAPYLEISIGPIDCRWKFVKMDIPFGDGIPTPWQSEISSQNRNPTSIDVGEIDQSRFSIWTKKDIMLDKWCFE